MTGALYAHMHRATPKLLPNLALSATNQDSPPRAYTLFKLHLHPLFKLQPYFLASAIGENAQDEYRWRGTTARSASAFRC